MTEEKQTLYRIHATRDTEEGKRTEELTQRDLDLCTARALVAVLIEQYDYVRVSQQR